MSIGTHKGASSNNPGDGLGQPYRACLYLFESAPNTDSHSRITLLVFAKARGAAREHCPGCCGKSSVTSFAIAATPASG
jgi:hypothetical protein